MECVRCEMCGKEIKVGKICVPMTVGTEDGKQDYCWCICEDCRDEFVRKSQRVLEERQKENKK